LNYKDFNKKNIDRQKSTKNQKNYQFVKSRDFF